MILLRFAGVTGFFGFLTSSTSFPVFPRYYFTGQDSRALHRLSMSAGGRCLYHEMSMHMCPSSLVRSLPRALPDATSLLMYFHVVLDCPAAQRVLLLPARRCRFVAFH